MYYQLPHQFLPDSLYIASMNIILKVYWPQFYSQERNMYETVSSVLCSVKFRLVKNKQDGLINALFSVIFHVLVMDYVFVATMFQSRDRNMYGTVSSALCSVYVDLCLVHSR